MKKAIYTILAAVALFLSSCSPQFTRLEQYPGMYEAKPVTLVVMPPINNTSNVDAKELLYTSISYPLIEAGYYVVSPHLTMEMLKAESGYDAEMLIERDAAIFAQVFGADAVVFSVIDEWAKKGFGIQTKLHYIIKSTKDNSVLFERTCDLYLDLSSRSSNSSEGLFGALVDLTASAVNTAVTKPIEAARKCNRYIFSDIPRGKYHPDFMNDGEVGASKKDISVTVR